MTWNGMLSVLNRARPDPRPLRSESDPMITATNGLEDVEKTGMQGIKQPGG